MTQTVPEFLDLSDLACEDVGGAAIACNDEFFAEKENLVKAHAAEWREHEYTARGKWMDGWETRRRREPGSDWCLVRLGLPGAIRGVVVDTAYFKGNYPAECSLEGAVIGDLEPLRPVFAQHHAAKFQATRFDLGIAGDRRAARAVERFQKAALGADCDAG